MLKTTIFKKILPSILIVVIFSVGIFGTLGIETAEAQQGSIGSTVGNVIDLTGVGRGILGAAKGIRNIFSATDCFSGDGLRGCAAAGGQIVLEAFGWILGITGVALNKAVDLTVIQMGTNVNKINTIEAGWKTFRDLANIIIIFSLLYIGIVTILNSEKYNTKKLLASLIMAAILINFSLFFAKVIIDSSNLLATNFYKQIQSIGTKGDSNYGIKKHPNWGGISDSYMQALSFTVLYQTRKDGAINLKNPGIDANVQAFDPDTGKIITKKAVVNIDKDTGEPVLNTRQIFFISLLGSILFLITAFSFLAVTFLLVVRYAVLIFLMMLSPIALAGMILPQMQKYSKMWWDNLIGYAFFAPAYLLLTLIIIRIINSEGFRSSIGFGNINTSVVLIIINFGIIIILIIFSILLSRYMGIWGSELTINAGRSARKWGQGVVGRNTVGYAGQMARRGITKGQKALERTEPKGRVGRTLKKIGLATTRGAKKGAYGVEGLKFQSTQSKRDVVEARDKDIERDIKERAGNPVQLAGYFTSLNNRQQQEAYRNMSDRDQAALDEQLDNKHHGGPLALGAAPRVLNPISEQLRKNLSTEKREKVEKAAKDAREKWENTEVRKIIDNIATGVGPIPINPSTGAPYTTSDIVKRLKPNEARKLSDSARRNANIIHELTPRHLADLQREGNLTPDQINDIMTEITGPAGYANQADQLAFVSNPVNSTYWS